MTASCTEFPAAQLDELPPPPNHPHLQAVLEGRPLWYALLLSPALRDAVGHHAAHRQRVEGRYPGTGGFEDRLSRLRPPAAQQAFSCAYDAFYTAYRRAAPPGDDSHSALDAADMVATAALAAAVYAPAVVPAERSLQGGITPHPIMAPTALDPLRDPANSATLDLRAQEVAYRGEDGTGPRHNRVTGRRRRWENEYRVAAAEANPAGKSDEGEVLGGRGGTGATTAIRPLAAPLVMRPWKRPQSADSMLKSSTLRLPPRGLTTLPPTAQHQSSAKRELLQRTAAQLSMAMEEGRLHVSLSEKTSADSRATNNKSSGSGTTPKHFVIIRPRSGKSVRAHSLGSRPGSGRAIVAPYGITTDQLILARPDDKQPTPIEGIPSQPTWGLSAEALADSAEELFSRLPLETAHTLLAPILHGTLAASLMVDNAYPQDPGEDGDLMDKIIANAAPQASYRLIYQRVTAALDVINADASDGLAELAEVEINRCRRLEARRLNHIIYDSDDEGHDDGKKPKDDIDGDFLDYDSRPDKALSIERSSEMLLLRQGLLQGLTVADTDDQLLPKHVLVINRLIKSRQSVLLRQPLPVVLRWLWSALLVLQDRVLKHEPRTLQRARLLRSRDGGCHIIPPIQEASEGSSWLDREANDSGSLMLRPTFLGFFCRLLTSLRGHSGMSGNDIEPALGASDVSTTVTPDPSVVSCQLVVEGIPSAIIAHAEWTWQQLASGNDPIEMANHRASFITAPNLSITAAQFIRFIGLFLRPWGTQAASMELRSLLVDYGVRCRVEEERKRECEAHSAEIVNKTTTITTTTIMPEKTAEGAGWDDAGVMGCLSPDGEPVAPSPMRGVQTDDQYDGAHGVKTETCTLEEYVVDAQAAAGAPKLTLQQHQLTIQSCRLFGGGKLRTINTPGPNDRSIPLSFPVGPGAPGATPSGLDAWKQAGLSTLSTAGMLPTPLEQVSRLDQLLADPPRGAAALLEPLADRSTAALLLTFLSASGTGDLQRRVTSDIAGFFANEWAKALEREYHYKPVCPMRPDSDSPLVQSDISLAGDRALLLPHAIQESSNNGAVIAPNLCKRPLTASRLADAFMDHKHPLASAVAEEQLLALQRREELASPYAPVSLMRRDPLSKVAKDTYNIERVLMGRLTRRLLNSAQRINHEKIALAHVLKPSGKDIHSTGDMNDPHGTVAHIRESSLAAALAHAYGLPEQPRQKTEPYSHLVSPPESHLLRYLADGVISPAYAAQLAAVHPHALLALRRAAYFEQPSCGECRYRPHVAAAASLGSAGGPRVSVAGGASPGSAFCYAAAIDDSAVSAHATMLCMSDADLPAVAGTGTVAVPSPGRHTELCGENTGDISVIRRLMQTTASSHPDRYCLVHPGKVKKALLQPREAPRHMRAIHRPSDHVLSRDYPVLPAPPTPPAAPLNPGGDPRSPKDAALFDTLRLHQVAADGAAPEYAVLACRDTIHARTGNQFTRRPSTGNPRGLRAAAIANYTRSKQSTSNKAAQRAVLARPDALAVAVSQPASIAGTGRPLAVPSIPSPERRRRDYYQLTYEHHHHRSEASLPKASPSQPVRKAFPVKRAMDAISQSDSQTVSAIVDESHVSPLKQLYQGVNAKLAPEGPSEGMNVPQARQSDAIRVGHRPVSAATRDTRHQTPDGALLLVPQLKALPFANGGSYSQRLGSGSYNNAKRVTQRSARYKPY